MHLEQGNFSPMAYVLGFYWHLTFFSWLLNYIPSGIRICFPLLLRIFLGLGPTPNPIKLMGLWYNQKKSPRIAENRFGYLEVCSLKIQCQKNPKEQAIGEKSQNLVFRSEFTTLAQLFDYISQKNLFNNT